MGYADCYVRIRDVETAGRVYVRKVILYVRFDGYVLVRIIIRLFRPVRFKNRVVQPPVNDQGVVYRNVIFVVAVVVRSAIPQLRTYGITAVRDEIIAQIPGQCGVRMTFIEVRIVEGDPYAPVRPVKNQARIISVVYEKSEQYGFRPVNIREVPESSVKDRDVILVYCEVESGPACYIISIGCVELEVDILTRTCYVVRTEIRIVEINPSRKKTIIACFVLYSFPS